MASSKLLKPGAMCVGRTDGDKIILWSSCNCAFDDVNGYAEIGDILVVLESKESFKQEELTLTPEWEKGAYYVLAPSGISGWVGAGWIFPING